MKKIIFLALTIFICNACTAQKKSIDSLKTILANTTKPADRFNIMVKILENQDSFLGNSIDSTDCVELLKIAQQQNNDAMLATSYNWIGYYFSTNKGENTIGLEYYFKGIPPAEKANDKRRLSSLYFDIAATFRTFKNTEEFYKYTIKGGENLPEKSSPMYDYMLVQYQRNMGLYFYDTNQLDSAAYYAQAMVQTANRLKRIVFNTQAMNLNGNINSKAGENELAEIYFKKAIAFADSINYKSRRAFVYGSYIVFLLKNNRLPDAKFQIDQMWDLVKQSDNQNLILLAAGYKRELFEKLDMTDSAYFYSRMEATSKEAIFNQGNLNVIQALAFKEQLRNIEEFSKQEQEKQQRKNNIQFALIALGIMTFIILFLVLSRSFITNTKMIEYLGIIALLLVFEFLNLLLHPFLETITHHTPILMLLALVCIAALLVPLHHRVEKWATHKLVEKNKAIRLQMAKKTIEQLGSNQ